MSTEYDQMKAQYDRMKATEEKRIIGDHAERIAALERDLAAERDARNRLESEIETFRVGTEELRHTLSLAEAVCELAYTTDPYGSLGLALSAWRAARGGERSK